ncbi:Hypothetical predicted protein, partial [Pelobates cultripes]
KLKQEMVKQAIHNSQQLDRLMEMPVTVQMRNKIIKTASPSPPPLSHPPPAYKQVINQTGNTLQLVTEAIIQLGELGDWAHPDHLGHQRMEILKTG